MQSSTNKLSGSIANATKWSAVTNIMRKLISPVTNMILARLLAPEAFGVVATIEIVTSFAERFADAGFQKYLVQHNFKDDDELDRASNVSFWTNLAISVVLFVCIAIFSGNLAALVGSPGYGPHLLVASLSLPLLSLSCMQQSLFRREFDFKGLFVPRLINSIIPLVVTIPLAFFTRSCWALILGTLAANCSDAILLTIKSKWKPRLYYSFAELKKMLSFSVWTFCESMSIWLSLNVDIFILGNILSSHYLGLYKSSISSVNQISNLIITTIIPVLFSALSRCQNDAALLHDVVYSFQKKSAVLLVPMSVGMFIYNDVVTWVLLGNQWMEAARFIGMIGLIQVFRVIYANFASEVYRAMGEPRVSFAVQLAYIFILIPGIYFGARHGFDVLCVTRALLMACTIIIHLTVLRLRYKFSIRQMLANAAQPLAASLIMAAVALLFRLTVDSMVVKLISVFLCALVYFASCMLFPDTRKTVMSVLVKARHSISGIKFAK